MKRLSTENEMKVNDKVRVNGRDGIISGILDDGRIAVYMLDTLRVSRFPAAKVAAR